MRIFARGRVVMVLALCGALGCTGDLLDAGGRPDPDVPDPDLPAASGPRAPRRLSAPQLQQALQRATGFDYLGRARVSDPSSPQGSVLRDDVALLHAYGASLGNPDYNYTVQQSLESGVTFSKITEDAIRSVCRSVSDAEVIEGAHPSGRAHLLFTVDAGTQLPGGEEAIRDNIARLALRYWGQTQSADDDDTTALLEVFRAGYEAGPLETPEPDAEPVPPLTASNAGGWRAVCIAMLSNPRFLTY